MQPPLELTNRLAAKLKLSPKTTLSGRLRFRLAWPAFVLLACTAFAAASPAVRAIVSHAWTTLLTAYSTAVPAEAPAAPARVPAEPSVSSNLTQSPFDQPAPLPPRSESAGVRPDAPGVPNMSCKDSDTEQWDNCVGLAKFENGNIYRGEFHHGLREGLGFLVVNDTGASDYNDIRSNNGPAIYAGEFRGGRLNGRGVWFTKSGAGHSGTFIDNIAQSDASHTNCNGTLSPSWSNCVARISDRDGNVYYGEYIDGRREGIGMLEIHETGTSDETSFKTPTAGVYVGEFRADRLNGRGMIFMPGAGFYGIFTNNILNTTRPEN